MGSHTYEIHVNGINWQGEVSWDGGQDIQVSTDSAIPETNIKEWQKVVSFFKQIGAVCAECGEIQKIEIVKK